LRFFPWLMAIVQARAVDALRRWALSATKTEDERAYDGAMVESRNIRKMKNSWRGY
jgi:hypothetical protein